MGDASSGLGVGVVAFGAEGRVLLIRRADTGGWALPGGTLEWNETLTSTVHREVDEEAGATVTKLHRISGVYSRHDRDPRFHAVTVSVVADVEGPLRGPQNALEIREARFFSRDDLPRGYPWAATTCSPGPCEATPPSSNERGISRA